MIDELSQINTEQVNMSCLRQLQISLFDMSKRIKKILSTQPAKLPDLSKSLFNPVNQIVLLPFFIHYPSHSFCPFSLFGYH